jgi:hypothetical protein
MIDTQILREQLLQLLQGGNAHISCDKVLYNFPSEKINEHPNTFPFSAWEILEHLRIAQWDILEFIRNPEHISPHWPDGYWPAKDEIAGASEWDHSVRFFQRDLLDVQDMVKDHKTDFTAPIAHAPKYSILREILLVADHNAYHIGQMVTLRKMLDIWNRK